MEEKTNSPEIKVICGWCKTHLSGRPDAELISHGICPTCFNEQMKSVTKVSREDNNGRR